MRGTRKSVWLLVGMVALFMLALGAAASATTGQDGPTPPEVSDPVAAHNDIWTVGATADFTLTFNDGTLVTTGTILADASPVSVEAALETLANVTDVRVRGTAGSYVVTIADPLGGTLTTGSAGTTVTQTQVGNGAITGQRTPHGAYSASTNFCLQCHDVHNANGAYALTAEVSVTATCGTCHGSFAFDDGTGTVVGPTGASSSGPGPGTIGTASMRTAYDTTSPFVDHGIGSGGIPSGGGSLTQSDWDYSTWKYGGDPTTDKFPGGQDATTPAGAGTSAQATGGLYCASCHTPHGEYGQVVNNWVASDEGSGGGDTLNGGAGITGFELWFDFGAGWTDAWLDYDAGDWYMCPTPGDVDPDAGHGVNCVSAVVRDSEDQVVSLFGYKLLSAFPNHSYLTEQSYNTIKYNHDGAGWCTACHTANDLEGSNHNHQTGCSACHGNPADGGSADFPHTSTKAKFLIDYPDALCISCHTPGSLP